MKKGNIQVAVRIRPTAMFAKQLDLADDKITVDLGKGQPQSGNYLDNQQKSWKFDFDHVMKDVPQETVYATCALPIVENVISGFNGTVFCYGQTGAGLSPAPCFLLRQDVHDDWRHFHVLYAARYHSPCGR